MSEEIKETTDIVIMKDGKFWGEVYSDGYCTQLGWVDFSLAFKYDYTEESAKHGPGYFVRPQDRIEVKDAKLVKVKTHKVINRKFENV